MTLRQPSIECTDAICRALKADGFEVLLMGEPETRPETRAVPGYAMIELHYRDAQVTAGAKA